MAAQPHGPGGALTLYYASGTCSLAPHVALREAGLPFDLVRVDLLRGMRLPDGRALREVSPKGYVPALVLETGELLTEGVAMVQYLADRAPARELAPPPGSFARVRLQEHLNFIATELHKGLSPLYAPKANDEYKQAVRERYETRLAVLAEAVGAGPWLMGAQFTVADPYAYYCLRGWSLMFKGDLTRHPGLAEYVERVKARPSVVAAEAAEKAS